MSVAVSFFENIELGDNAMKVCALVNMYRNVYS